MHIFTIRIDENMIAKLCLPWYRGEWMTMKDQQINDNEHQKRTKDLHVRIPMALAKRIKSYANKNSTTTTNVVIEALDEFLRERKNRPAW